MILCYRLHVYTDTYKCTDNYVCKNNKLDILTIILPSAFPKINGPFLIAGRTERSIILDYRDKAMIMHH